MDGCRCNGLQYKRIGAHGSEEHLRIAKYLKSYQRTWGLFGFSGKRWRFQNFQSCSRVKGRFTAIWLHLKRMKLYCLSGLGVDHRAFQNLHIEGVELVHIPWVDPHKNESLSDYAIRLFDSASLPEDYHLLGVSFGGMIAQEFEKIRPPKSLFLVSTISDRSELSGLFKLGGTLRLHKIIPAILLKRPNALTHFLFGVKKQEDKELFRAILNDSDIPFFRWAMGAIVRWNNAAQSAGIKLHGGKDRILSDHGKAGILLPKAGHFMIVTHGKELSRLECWNHFHQSN